MSQTYTLGKVAPTPRGAYNGTTQYYQLDIVSNNGSSYIVLQDCIGIAPPNSTYYMQIASKGDTGDNGQSPTISVGSVTSGSTPSVTNVGTNVNAVFDFVLPTPIDEPYIVTLTPTALDYSGTMDKTVSEINSAYESGRKIVFRIAASETDTVDIDCTIVQKNSQFTYPSFVIYNILSTGSSGYFVHAFTGVTDNGSKNTYTTYVYTLTLSN